MVIYFVKLGRFIENISKNKTTSAIKKLVTITPREAIMKKGSDFISVSLDEIQKGDVLICRPGEKFAVDGEVVEGEGYVDESFITGESVPILKKKEKGRNKDINVKDMGSYQAMKDQMEKDKKALEIASKKSSELDKSTIDIKDAVNNLKKATIKKNTYTISENDKNKILEYIDKVDKTNSDFKRTEKSS